ncbi:MAG: GGDEF domain-containing protein [Blautia wexlerae]
MDMNLSFSVLTADIISILLIGTLYLANRQKAEYDRDMRLLQQMMVTIGIANISDSCVYYLAGSSNIVIKVLVFLSGSGLFLGNVMIGYLWAKFIMVHMNIPFSDIRRNIYRTIGLISIVLLVINIFYPLVFSVSDGRYQRGFAYIIFLIFAAFYILDSLYLYVKRVKKNGSLKLFPVHIFLIPVILGVVIQAFFVEIAITWTSIAISVAGIMTALKNEIIFTDCLTGLYNRVYLEFLHKRACNKKDCWVSGIMIDLNGFKQINDNYGHAEGDLALCIVADLLRKSFSEYGVVTRYAGDEFVIMLNTTDDQLIQKIIKSAKKNFVTENEKNDKPYQLSASMGYAITNLSNETIDDFMNRIDEQMYQDKMKYYEHNDRRNSK